MELLSVIMPVYNAQNYLKESIESILNETYENFEFIIINDGSTDKSLEIIKDYTNKDKRIKLIDRVNKGLVYSLNEGIKLAKGKFIVRMDADDICYANRFEDQIDFFRRNQDVDILGSRIITINEMSEHIETEVELRYGKQIESDANAIELFLKENIICHPSVMIKKECIELLGGYREKYNCAEDYDLWIRALQSKFIIKNLDKILLKYRLHEMSKCTIESKDFRTIKDMINIRLDAIEDNILKEKKGYYIWGASNAGKITRTIMKDRFKNMIFKGYIDKNKIGELEGKKIIKPQDISKSSGDYIFIATKPGKAEAEKVLIKKDFKKMDDFLWMV